MFIFIIAAESKRSLIVISFWELPSLIQVNPKYLKMFTLSSFFFIQHNIVCCYYLTKTLVFWGLTSILYAPATFFSLIVSLVGMSLVSPQVRCWKALEKENILVKHPLVYWRIPQYCSSKLHCLSLYIMFRLLVTAVILHHLPPTHWGKSKAFSKSMRFW